MKRLAAVAVTVALVVGWSSCASFAQHGGGSHGGGGFSGGGFSGSRGGFSGSHAGFGMPSGGFAPRGGSYSAPRGGFYRPAPPMSSMSPRMYGFPQYGSARPIYGSAQYGSARFASRGGPSSYPGDAMRPVGSPSMPAARYGSFAGNAMRPAGGPSMPATSTSGNRATYHSPNGGNHNHDGHDHNHNHVVIVSTFPYYGYPYYGLGLGYGYPYWGWGYSSFLNDDYNSQPSAYYAPQPQQYYYYNDPSQQQPYNQNDQQEQPAPETYPQQQYPPPSGSARAPYTGAQSSPATSEALTVVFKDGRPPEHVYNYLLTPNTLTVLDQHRHDIPVDQINLEATASVNIQAGVEFSLPVRTP